MTPVALTSDALPSVKRAKSTWLFSRNVDLGVFVGSALLAGAAIAIGALAGVLDGDTPSWAWVPAIVLCDVAHVWSTAFRTYLDPVERRARPTLLVMVPLLGLAAGIALHAFGHLVFWRTLAYLAIFHFVRQQYGWVSLYRARAGETDRATKIVDTAAIYAATLYPLLHWHTHLPRRFSWFVPGDIVGLGSASIVMPIATALYVAAMSAYVVRSLVAWKRGRGNPGKDVVVATTAAAWFTGIVVFDSDYAFTVTNVIMHGVPYFALVYVHSRRATATLAARASTAPAPARPSVAARLTRNVVVFLGALWLVAFVEEMLWDRAVWHDRSWLFGGAWGLPAAIPHVVVPLLALPQLIHSVLDAFIWRRRSNPSVARLVETTPASAATASRDALDVETMAA